MRHQTPSVTRREGGRVGGEPGAERFTRGSWAPAPWYRALLAGIEGVALLPRRNSLCQGNVPRVPGSRYTLPHAAAPVSGRGRQTKPVWQASALDMKHASESCTGTA